VALAFSSPSPARFLLTLAISIGLALLVFHHANTHGSKHATAWGILTFLAAPIVAAIYFIRYWLSSRQQRRY
jgi:lipopolysaccharide export LptBFGC system permease protein LptF